MRRGNPALCDKPSASWPRNDDCAVSSLRPSVLRSCSEGYPRRFFLLPGTEASAVTGSGSENACVGGEAARVSAV